ncbi:MAG: AzlD domain-containing protein, partial [Burkholderiales bacterium]|nr:AzlD domain-containing protein [Burkholderiales bacterium]
MKDLGYLFATFAVMMAISFGERAVPFIASNWLQKQKWVKAVAEFLPLSVMAILVVHTCVQAAENHAGLPIPEILAVVVTLILQWFSKNSLRSIFAGTLTYIL